VPRRDPFADPQTLIRRVYAYVAYCIGETDGPDAEDVTSATIERVLRYRDRFEAHKGDAATWLIGIARKQISEHHGELALPVAEPPGRVAPGEFRENSEAKRDLRRAVAGLGDDERELIALRYGADLTARQIGELFGLQTNAVEVALHRALNTLRHGLSAPE
jgi:RNA polymerase sigma-70 factor, ECF subfamily